MPLQTKSTDLTLTPKSSFNLEAQEKQKNNVAENVSELNKVTVQKSLTTEKQKQDKTPEKDLGKETQTKNYERIKNEKIFDNDLKDISANNTEALKTETTLAEKKQKTDIKHPM